MNRAPDTGHLAPPYTAAATPNRRACRALGAVALLATYLPARRAAKVDPMEALRYE